MIFDRVIHKIKGGCFYWDTVYIGTFDVFVLNLLVDTRYEILYVISGLRQHVHTVKSLHRTSTLIG